MILLQSWPPHYSIRKSKRIKRLSLQICPKNGLEVVVPAASRFPRIQALLNRHRAWIEKNRALILAAEQIKTKAIDLPVQINFQAIHRNIQITYLAQAAQKLKLKYSHAPGFEIGFCEISGPLDHKKIVFKLLNRFLKQQAKMHLVPWLNQISQEIQLSYSSVGFRSQVSLWGSCNAKKKISLNVKLLFLPSHLVRYVLIHELCHTRYLNHSKHFWNLVLQFDPNAFAHRKALRASDSLIPSWISVPIQGTLQHNIQKMCHQNRQMELFL